MKRNKCSGHEAKTNKIKIFKRDESAYKYIDKDFGPVDKNDTKGGAFAMYKTGEIPKKGYPEPSEVKWVHA